MRVLYLDCLSGASGDMILGALLDAGAPLDEVRAAVSALRLPGWRLEVETVRRAGVRATRATVTTEEQGESRRLPDIRSALESASLPGKVAELADATFSLLARAEARVHGVSEEEVHFHEVGALDALVDIVGSCAAFAALRPERVTASPVPTGSGWVQAEHGALPLPAPAVAEIAREVGAPLYGRGEAELLTPTGAALLGTLVHEFGPLPAMRIDCIGYGAGSADLDRPNVLRVLVGESARERPAEDAVLVECNLDDMNPELVPHLIDTLLDAGAHDAWAAPVVMKKGRPALVVSVLTPGGLLDRVSEIVFEETTTLGLRRSPVTREVLERSWVSVDVAGHPVRVKLGTRDGRIVTASPEHDDARAVARATGMALRRVYSEALEGVRPRSP